MKNVELNLEELSMIRKALFMLHQEAFKQIEENGVNCFAESPEEKYLNKVDELYDYFSQLEDDLEEELED